MRKVVETSIGGISTSPKKLNVVLAALRKKSAKSALESLQFMQKSVAGILHKILKNAMASAENNHGLDIDRLVLDQATVGRSVILKRLDVKGRGRAGTIRKTKSRVYFRLKEEA